MFTWICKKSNVGVVWQQVLCCLAFVFLADHTWSGTLISPREYPQLRLLAAGIDNYADSKIAPLRSSESDARSISSALADPRVSLSKHPPVILLGASATKNRILSEAKQLARDSKKNDVVLIFFSGHAGSGSLKDNANAVLYAHDADSTSGNGSISIVDDLLPIALSRQDIEFVLIADGCHIGNALYNKIQSDYPNISVISSSKNDQVSYEGRGGGTVFALALLTALTSSTSDLDGDGSISVEEAYVSLYPRAVKVGFARQHPSIAGLHVHRVPLVKVPSAEIVFEDAIPREILAEATISINGTQVQIDQNLSGPNKLVLLGNPSGLIGRGLTYIESAKHQVMYWREEQALKEFASPYKRSAAVLVAINDYERLRDPKKRGKTGFDSRGMMVESARELKKTLVALGFQQSNIIELYDEQATSAAIDDSLKKFWRGAEAEGVERVFFYFGGHGTTVDRTGILVTYDFDAGRPTQTGFLMRDLTTRHSENIVAKHLLVALDACSSGLAVFHGLGDSSIEQVPEFQQLSIIRNDTASKARNFLVAGTGDQPAVWDQGGIFTRALIGGLNGKADLNKDRLIQFNELATYVTNQVSMGASRFNVRQQVRSSNLDNLGEGKIIFIQQPIFQNNAGAAVADRLK